MTAALTMSLHLWQRKLLMDDIQEGAILQAGARTAWFRKDLIQQGPGFSKDLTIYICTSEESNTGVNLSVDSLVAIPKL